MEDAAVLPHLAAFQNPVSAPVSPRKSCPSGCTFSNEIRAAALSRVILLPCKRAKDGWELLRQDVLRSPPALQLRRACAGDSEAGMCWKVKMLGRRVRSEHIHLTNAGLATAAIGNGLALVVLVYATAGISGGHLNPAVSTAFLVTGRCAPHPCFPGRSDDCSQVSTQ